MDDPDPVTQHLERLPDLEARHDPRLGQLVEHDHDDGLVAVIDTTITPELRAEGDARELQRAIQDLRKEAGTDLDDRIELWVDGLAPEVVPFLASVAADTLADQVHQGPPPGGLAVAAVRLETGEARIALRRTGGAA